jgi:hypothetical protein
MTSTNHGQARHQSVLAGLKRYVSVLASLACLILPPSLIAQQKAVERTSELTYESFIQNPPAITNAVWEEETPARTMLDEAAKAFHTTDTNIPAETLAYRLMYDGENYFLGHVADVHSTVALGGSGGQFKSVQWGTHYGLNPKNCFVVAWDTNSDPVEAMLADLNHKVKGPPYSMVNQELMARYSARKFLCLGMFEMVPGTLIWGADRHEFTATYDEPTAFNPVMVQDAASGSFRTNYVPMHGQMTVKLTYEDEVPTKAEVAMDCGIQYTLLYKYSSNFANGRLPVEFSRYFDLARGDEGRAYTIRVNKLEFASAPIPMEAFDFHKALDRRRVSVRMFSKGEVYRETKTGLEKVFTKEELAAGKTTRYGKAQTVRMVALVLLLLAGALPIFLTFRNRTKIQTQLL